MKTLGICFGGYSPLHQGHLDVIMQAKKETDHCYVVVCGYDNEPRGAEIGADLDTRVRLITDFFSVNSFIGEIPLLTVLRVNDTELGIDESMSDNNWKIWTNYVIRQVLEAEVDHKFDTDKEYIDFIDTHIYQPIDSNEPEYDIVFYVGETKYVTALNKCGLRAKLIGWTDSNENHRANNVSGTMIRENPVKYWDKIARPFRQFFTKRILITGTASEGKTTLTTDIARYFNLPFTDERARTIMKWDDKKDTDLDVSDFIDFIDAQNYDIARAVHAPNNRGVMISDTDNLVTLMYAKAYIDNNEMKMSKDDYYNILLPHAKKAMKIVKWDKIFLIKPHNKFVDDGSRYMGQSSIDERMKNFNILLELLDEFGLMDKVQIIEGTYLEHYEIVKSYVNSILKY